MKKLTFDDLVALGKTDPAALTRYRQDAACEAIAEIRQTRGADAARKASALQWKIDVLCVKTKNPLVLNTKLSVMMNQQLAELAAALSKLRGTPKC